MSTRGSYGGAKCAEEPEFNRIPCCGGSCGRQDDIDVLDGGERDSITSGRAGVSACDPPPGGRGLAGGVVMNESSALRVLATVCQEVPRSRWESHFVLASCHHPGPQSGHAGCLMRRAVSIPPCLRRLPRDSRCCVPVSESLGGRGSPGGLSPGWVLAGPGASRRQAGSELPPSSLGGRRLRLPAQGGVLCGDAVVGDNPRTA